MGKQCSGIAPLKWIFLNLISDDKGLKDDKTGGRTNREIELGRWVARDSREERWRYKEDT